jgi:hypothetical protein
MGEDGFFIFISLISESAIEMRLRFGETSIVKGS